ncbi:MAG: TIGR04211 family SH3 domain-containing protein [Magnetococcales bacterium]|nr:TIGR04211 family SH3 domain-containing protein [Magnetococcales bacterium]
MAKHAHLKGLRHLGVLSMVLLAGTSFAETVYISDIMTDVSLRKGEGTEFKIARILKTGDTAELVESRESGWSFIRLGSGVEGWVLTRYLSKEVPARQQLEGANAARLKAEGDRDRLSNELKEVRKQLGNQKALQDELDRIRKVSQEALQMEAENKSLKEQVGTLESKVQNLSDEKRLLERRSDTQFFMAGAGVLILGWIIGMVMARRRRRPVGVLE